MKRSTLLIALLMPLFSIGQTDEELRQQIRKEILEEQRLKEEKELLEYRKAKIRREEEARIQAEKDSIQQVLIEKSKKRQSEQAPNVKPSRQKNQEEDLERMTSKRIDGWSVMVSGGASFPLGEYALSNSSGYYAKTGGYVALDNYWHFGRVMGLNLGVSYDNNGFNGYKFRTDNIGQTPQGLNTRESSRGYKNTSFRFGPNIRYLGRNGSLYFAPFAGLAVHQGAYYYFWVSDGSNAGEVRMQGKQSTHFITGANLDGVIHFGGRVDLSIGAGFVYGKARVVYVLSGTGSPTQNVTENYDVIRLYPRIGFRFHL